MGLHFRGHLREPLYSFLELITTATNLVIDRASSPIGTPTTQSQHRCYGGGDRLTTTVSMLLPFSQQEKKFGDKFCCDRGVCMLRRLPLDEAAGGSLHPPLTSNMTRRSA